MRRALPFALLACLLAPVRAQDNLAASFVTPPSSAKPHTWWHWMNGQVTREGITLDLEAMARVGVGGAQMFHIDGGIPAGPVGYMSDEWRQLITHAVKEADRLGMELCIHNCAGWSSSGGPWITPELAMQMVTFSERQVTGPGAFAESLAQPPTRLDTYRDIAVLAFPTPPAEADPFAARPKTITLSDERSDPAPLCDGNPGTYCNLPLPRPNRPQDITITLAQPFTARALSIACGGGRQGHGGELQVSDDGETWRTVRPFRISQSGTTPSTTALSFDPVTSQRFRLHFTAGATRGSRMSLGEVELSGAYRIDNWGGKAGYSRADRPRAATGLVDAGAVVKRDQIVDLTSKLAADGTLTWDVPAGKWTVLRLGYTPTGKDNHPAPPEGRGLECDKLSAEAAEFHFNQMVGKVLSDVGPLGGKALNNVLIDSYEVGAQNWTSTMPADFEALCGYDLKLWLPTLTGRVVDDLDSSERFLWDFRRTIADLFASDYFGEFQKLCHQHGLLLSIEGYGNGGFDNLQAGGLADVPMGEFWAGTGGDIGNAKLASSAAHTNGRTYVGAEAFTASPENAGWRQDPALMKQMGDLMWTGGINRFIFHRYAHQPWVDLQPGMTMGQWGFHFDRTSTWFEPGRAWLKYLARCQYLLQSGKFAADLLYFEGEDAPSSLSSRGSLKVPNGYDYDGCDRTALQDLTVKNGRVTFPDGMSYAVLVLPNDDRLTPEAATKVKALIEAGATVVGPLPNRSPSLANQPQADRIVADLGKEVWSDVDGEMATQRRFGQGKIVWGEPLDKVLRELGVAPDVVLDDGTGAAGGVWIHRTIDGTEAYFVSNQSNQPTALTASFRITDRAPELWDAETGTMQPAAIWHVADGRTVVPLSLSPAGSVWVMFRKPAAAAHAVELLSGGEPVGTQQVDLSGRLEILRAEYGVLSSDMPDATDVAQLLTQKIEDGKLRIQATNTAFGGDPAPNIVKSLWVKYTLDGTEAEARVDENQTLVLPPDGQTGKLVIVQAYYGDLPDPVKPAQRQTVDVTKQLQAAVANGRLRIRADNAIAGDPANLIVKQMAIDYAFDGVTYHQVYPENATVVLPTGREPGLTLFTRPGAELDVHDGKLRLTAWRDGSYEVVGPQFKKAVPAQNVPQPVELTGPWTLSFPAGWSAPASVTLPKLISWTDHEHEGVKYFSGTATYRRTFDLPAAMAGPGKRVRLDLGVVRNLAQVAVDGQDLGILWKMPFEVELPAGLQAGQHELTVAVTNLWPNRLIGDEKRFDSSQDGTWSGLRPTSWNDWLKDPSPKPPSGRKTWTTWRHWTANDEPLTSGLLGPVTLVCGVTAAAE